jgi:hypothetical protein
MVATSGDWGYSYTDAATKLTTFYPLELKTLQEYSAGLTYLFKQYNVKVIADITKQIDVPFANEVGHGVYNLMLQPGSITGIRTGGYELGDAILGRMVVQYDF